MVQFAEACEEPTPTRTEAVGTRPVLVLAVKVSESAKDTAAYCARLVGLVGSSTCRVRGREGLHLPSACGLELWHPAGKREFTRKGRAIWLSAGTHIIGTDVDIVQKRVGVGVGGGDGEVIRSKEGQADLQYCTKAAGHGFRIQRKVQLSTASRNWA